MKDIVIKLDRIEKDKRLNALFQVLSRYGNVVVGRELLMKYEADGIVEAFQLMGLTTTYSYIDHTGESQSKKGRKAKYPTEYTYVFEVKEGRYQHDNNKNRIL